MDESQSEPHTLRISEGQLVMPFYMIIDLSASMSDDIQTLRTVTEELITRLRRDPAADDTALLSVIGFGTDAKVLVPLSRLSDIGTLPQFDVLGSTSYVSAWETYDRAVKADYDKIKNARARLHRPCVFFLTDGFPNPDEQVLDGSETRAPLFRRRFLELQGENGVPYWPYVLSYGFRDANETTLSQLAYPNFGEKRGRWFLLAERDVAAVLADIESLLYQTIIQTSATGSSNNPEHRPALPPESSTIRHAEVDQVF